MSKEKKLTEKELKELQDVINKEHGMKNQFFDVCVSMKHVQEAHKNAWDDLASAQKDIMKLKEKYTKKYGDISINISTGAFVETDVETEGAVEVIS